MDKSSLIHKVLSGAATRSERHQLQEWIDLSKENRREFDDISLLWENSSTSPPASDLALKKIKSIVHASSLRRRRNRRLRIILIVTTLVIMISLMIIISVR